MSPSSQRVAGLSFPQLVHFIVVIPPVNDNLEAAALSIYKCFFVDYIPFDGSQPSSWKEVTVDDIASDVICGKTPPTADPQNYGGTIPFITIPDMHGSVYTTSTARFLS